MGTVKSHFKYHSKGSMLLPEARTKSGITNDHLHRLKHEFPTHWHSTLGAMTTYSTGIDCNSAVAQDLEVGQPNLLPAKTQQRNTLAEFIFVW